MQSLQLQSNEIKNLSKSLSTLKKLEYLRLDHNKLETITPNEISSCSNLIYLNVSHNKLDSLNVLNYYFLDKNQLLWMILFYFFFNFLNCLPNLEQLEATFLNLKTLNEVDPSRCRQVINYCQFGKNFQYFHIFFN